MLIPTEATVVYIPTNGECWRIPFYVFFEGLNPFQLLFLFISTKITI